MESKKINQLATAVSPSTSDLAIIGDPITGVSKKITWLQVSTLIGTAANLQQVTDNGATTTNPVTIGGLTISGLSTGVLKSDSGIISSVPFGAANGVATLGGDGKVPSSQLPSYVDDVVEVANYAALPATGETGKLYITLDNNKVYRWGGSVYVEVAANNAVWGSITGTLSNQTDLQNALNAKVPTSRIITINGTSYDLSANRTWSVGTLTSVGLTMPSGFNVASSPLTGAGGTIAVTGAGDSTQYIDGSGALQTFPTLLSSDNLVKLVRNQSGATMTAGTIVYISGATGNKPLISKAIATSDATSAQTYGLVQANIANNADGYVVVIGNVGSLDTSALTEGQQLYLSGTTAGAYTTTKPYAPTHLVYVGIVLRSHPVSGIIGVKIQNGYEMDELHNVDAYAPSNNDILSYNTSTSLWEHKQIATTLGFTPISLASLSATSPLSYNNTTGAFSIQVATASQNGYLSSTDWSTFNNKQAALGGTGFVKISGSTISYDNSTYYLASNPSGYITLASLSAGTGISYSNTTGVISSTITQYTDALARAAISSSATGLTYTSATGVFSLTAGYSIPTTAKQTEWDTAYTNRITSLTTTGTSGAATLVANTLNIPNYGSALSGYVTLATAQTISANKTFSEFGFFDKGVLIKQGNYPASSGYNGIGAISGGFYFGIGQTSVHLLSFSTSNSYNYTYPNATGTLALTSDIPSLAGYITGSGTNGRVALFSSTSAIENSQIYDNGTTIGIGSSVTSQNKLVSVLDTNSATAYAIMAWATGVDTGGLYSNVKSGNIFNGQGEVGGVSSQRIVINNAGVITLATWQGVAIADTYISSAATWNAKQAALNGTGFVKATGTTISYDNSTYLTTSSAASTYVPYTGATGSVNLGSNNLLLGSGNAGGHIDLVGSTDTAYLNVESAGAKINYNSSTIALTDKQFGGTLTLSLRPSLTTGNAFVQTFQAATGTIALTSQIPTLAGLGGVPTSRTLTINGTAYDLTADRSWTITAGVSGSGTNNYIPKFTSTGSTIGDSIISSTGTNSEIIDVTKNGNWGTRITIGNTTDGSVAQSYLGLKGADSDKFFNMGKVSASFSPPAWLGAGDGYLYNGTANLSVYNQSGNIQFRSNAATGNYFMITSSIPVSVGNGTTISGRIEFYKDTTPTKAGSIGTGISGGSSTDNVIIGTYNATSAWVNRMTIFNPTSTSGARVSIGGTSDGFGLSVEGSAVADACIQLNNTSAAGHGWSFYSTGTGYTQPTGNLLIYRQGLDSSGGFGTFTWAGSFGLGTLLPSGIVNGKGIVIYDTDYPRLILQNSTSGTGTGAYSGLWMAANTLYVQNSSTTGGIYFGVNSSSEAMVLNASGNLGIGTNAPTAKLTIAGTSDLAWSASTSKLQISRSGSVARLQNYDTGSAATLSLQWDGGNLGIGTQSPITKMEVRYNGNNGGGDYTGYNILATTDSTSNSYQATIGAMHQGSGYANLNLGSKDVGGLNLFWHISKRLVSDAHRLEYYWYDGTNFNSKFYFTPDGLSYQLGNHLIGTTSENSFGSARSIQINGSGGSLLETRYNGTSGARFGSGSDHSYHHDPRNAEMRFATSDVTRFYIYGNGNYSFTGSNVSDRRAKDNILLLDITATDKIMSLEAKTYNMKNNPSQKRYGFIAQEVQQIISDLVSGNENDGYLGLDYSGLLTLTIKALQEQQKEIQILKQK
jgi:hypothetical protein